MVKILTYSIVCLNEWKKHTILLPKIVKVACGRSRPFSTINTNRLLTINHSIVIVFHLLEINPFSLKENQNVCVLNYGRPIVKEQMRRDLDKLRELFTV